MQGGRLIVFEGPEGAGKSTQLSLLLEALTAARLEAVSFREPGGTQLGDAVRALLLDPASPISPAAEALLFMASRAELCEMEVRPALQRGLIVLLDRFFLSTYAYQVVGRGLPEDEVRAANKLATGGLVPDLTVLLDQPVAEGLSRVAARGSHDRIERSSDDFHNRVASAFRSFVEPHWLAAHPEAGPIVRVDAQGTQMAVFSRVVDAMAFAFPDELGQLKVMVNPATAAGARS